MILAQAVPQISAALVVAEDSEPLVPFPFFLGMVPWGHHIEILQNCKDIREAVFYVEKTIQNNWSRAMLGCFYLYRQLDADGGGTFGCPSGGDGKRIQWILINSMRNSLVHNKIC